MGVVTDILARLSGKSFAWDNTDDLAEVLAKRCTHLRDTRVPAHLAGAARLDSQLAYQPGLVELLSEAYDSELYLEALLTCARSAGYGELAERLAEAAEGMHEATLRLFEAAHATVHSPQIPLTGAA